MPDDGQNGFAEWGGYMDAKITKLEEQFSAASESFRQSDLFAGISIFVNGLTSPSADELKRLMMVHGGTFHHYQRAHTSFVIAANLPDVKVRNMNTSKIISAQWVTDSLRERRILDYSKYLLYTERKTSQPRLHFRREEGCPANTSLAAPPKDPPKHPPKATPEDAAASLQLAEGLKCLNAAVRGAAMAGHSATAEAIKTEEPKGKMPKPEGPKVDAPARQTSAQARTAVDPRFLAEFYNNSRLHHIATLGAAFKDYVTELRETHGLQAFPQRQRLLERLKATGAYSPLAETADAGGSFVMHIDMDCFFVSVGLRHHPQLRGQPVAVTHSKGGAGATTVPVAPGADRRTEAELFAKRFEDNLHNNVLADKVRGGFDASMSLSEISSCSYEARARGVRNGMFVGHALKLCPELKTIPYDFEGYREVAQLLYQIVAQYTLDIEAVSCDEMFVDLGGVLRELRLTPMDFVGQLRAEVKESTGCPCSAGVGANKLQARMATKRAKPDGQFWLAAADVAAYMAPLPVEELPGVGSSTAHTLQAAKLSTCGDLQRVSLAQLQALVGRKMGETLAQFCRGNDLRPLVYSQLRKSVSAEVNYGIRFKDNAELETFLRQLCVEVRTRLVDIKRRAKCVTLKLMVRAQEAPVEASKFMGHGVCDHVTKSFSLSDFTDDLETISNAVLATMRALAVPPNELRGIGVQLNRLDEPAEGAHRRENVLKTMFSKAAEKQKERPPQAPKVEAEPRLETSTSASRSPVKANGKRTRGGRPKEAKNRPNVIGMLQSAAAKRAAVPVPPTRLPPDIDPEVFAELPPDIQAEILRDVSRSKPPEVTALKPPVLPPAKLNESDMRPSTSREAEERRQRRQDASRGDEPVMLKVDSEFLDSLPPDLRTEIELHLRRQQEERHGQKTPSPPPSPPPPPPVSPLVVKEDTADNMFAQDNCKDLLLEWVETSAQPAQCDVDLVVDHARNLVRAKDIERLYGPLLHLCRLINSLRGGDCEWHAAFRAIVASVQDEMRAVYEGRKLFIGTKLRCDKCAGS